MTTTTESHANDSQPDSSVVHHPVGRIKNDQGTYQFCIGTAAKLTRLPIKIDTISNQY